MTSAVTQYMGCILVLLSTSTHLRAHNSRAWFSEDNGLRWRQPRDYLRPKHEVWNADLIATSSGSGMLKVVGFNAWPCYL